MLFGEKTIETLKELDGTSIVTMDYVEDYKFDEFLKVGAKSDAELNVYIMENLLDGRRLDYDLPDVGCSTFVANILNGECIFGRNFDQIECRQLVLKTQPKNGYESLSVVNLSYIGLPATGPLFTENNRHFILSAPYLPLDGVNSCGLAIGILKIPKASTNQNTGKIGLNSTAAIRLVLDKCATVDEAVEILGQYDMHASANSDFHFHIADRSGKSVVVEYVENEMVVVESDFATNFLLTPGVEVGHGHDRYEKMKNTVAENCDGFCDKESAMSLLKDVSANSTRWSAIYGLESCSMLLSVNRNYDELYTFNL